ncbi:hypothetical protein ABID47_002834 [Paenibacillus favisporus]|uniref:Uncharacterized protein n=1 Tax=Paenibacillus favisporus TaxID=221028 RepID=A0ABV2F388_9BACL
MGCRGFFAFGNVRYGITDLVCLFRTFRFAHKGKCSLIDSEVKPPEPKLRGLFVIHSRIGGIFT